MLCPTHFYRARKLDPNYDKYCTHEGCNSVARCGKQGQRKCRYHKDTVSHDLSCSIKGCHKPSNSRGWCRMHYARWQRYGDPEKVTKASPDPNHWTRKCVVEGCNDSSCKYLGGAGKYCRRHYAQFKKHGKIVRVERAWNKPEGKCFVLGCERDAKVKGRCKIHDSRWGHKQKALKKAKEIQDGS